MMQEDLIELMEWVLDNPDDRLGPYNTTFLYGPDEWLDAAKQAQEGDFTDLCHMAERSELVDEYHHGTDDNGVPWEEWDFEEFFDMMRSGVA